MTEAARPDVTRAAYDTVGIDLSPGMIQVARRDHPRLRVTYDIYRRRPEQVERLLVAAGFTPLARLIREPDGMPAGTPPAAYLLFKKV